MREWMESAVALRIGWVLVHSLWEGAAVCVVAGVVLWMLRRGRAAVRYGVAAAALAGMVVVPVGTFWVLNPMTHERPATRATVIAPGSLPVPSVSLNNTAPTGGTVAPTAVNTGGGARMPAELPAPIVRPAAVRASWLEASLPYAVVVWAVGVMLLSLWHLGGWVAVQRLRVVETRRAPAAVEAVLARLAERLGVRRGVRILESLRVEVPMLLGVWKPLILMPPAMLLGLAPGQLEAILAHELAHIRRYDYVALLLQRVAETVLFYHPGVWWLSRRMRLEQEQCCDDLAVAVVGDKRVYAGALAAIEEIRQAGAMPGAALAVTGSGARELMMRIARLVGREVPRAPGRARVAGAAMVVSTGLLAALMLALATMQPVGAQTTNQGAASSIARTLPAPQGTVKDSAGKAVAGAKVVLYYNAANWGLDDRTVETVTSDGQGHFQFTQALKFKAIDARDGDSYALIARQAGYGFAWEVLHADSVQTPVELVLTPARTQVVRVADAEGQPLAGVRIGLRGAGTSEDLVAQFRKGLNLDSDPGIFTQTTNAQGEATLSDLPKTLVWYSLTAPGYGRVTATEKGPGPVVMQLTRAATVEGRVVDPQGRGVPEAVVTFHISRDIWSSVLVRTDSEGRFSAELIAKGGVVFRDVRTDGDYEVTVSHPSFAAKRTTLSVTPGQVVKDLSFQAVPGTVVNGRVLEPGTEKPVGFARLMGESAGGRVDLYSDAEGRFSWRTMGPGEVTVYFERPPEGFFVRSDSFVQGGSKLVAIEGTEGQVELTLHTVGPVEQQKSLAGRVLTEEGRPVANLRVEASAVSGGPGYWGGAKSGEDGRFVLKGVPSGVKLNLYVQTVDRQSAGAAQASTGEGAQVAAVDLRLQRTETADVLVTDEQGKPLANTRINVFPSFDQYTPDALHQLDTDGAGHLNVDGILRGNQYQVRLAHRVPGADKALEDSCVYLTLLPKEGAPHKTIVLSHLMPLRIVDEAGKAVPMTELSSIEVEIAPRSLWQQRFNPQIAGRLEDGSILVERDNLLLAHTSNKVIVKFKTTGGVAGMATAAFPDNSSRIDLALQPIYREAGVQLGSVPADVGGDELAGQIVDPAGKPIARARVSIPQPRPGALDNALVATSDAQGVFRLANVRRFLFVQIEAPGFARRWLTTVQSGKAASITLDNTTHLRGTVRGADGKAASGVEIRLVTSRPRKDDPADLIPNLQFAVQADERGAYDALVEPGEYELFATGPGGVFARMPKVQVKQGQTVEQPVSLAAGVHLRVKAVSSLTGQPLAGVKFCIGEYQQPYVTLVRPGTERTSNAEGIADWESVMPGEQSIEPYSPEYARWYSPAEMNEWRRSELDNQPIYLDLKPGMDEVLVRMEPAMHISGRIVDPRGQGVGNVWVNVEGFQTGDRRYMRKTTDKGEFDLQIPGQFQNGGMYHVVVARESSYQKADAQGPDFVPKPGGEKTFTIALPEAPNPATTAPRGP